MASHIRALSQGSMRQPSLLLGLARLRTGSAGSSGAYRSFRYLKVPQGAYRSLRSLEVPEDRTCPSGPSGPYWSLRMPYLSLRSLLVPQGAVLVPQVPTGPSGCPYRGSA